MWFKSSEIVIEIKIPWDFEGMWLNDWHGSPPLQHCQENICHKTGILPAAWGVGSVTHIELEKDRLAIILFNMKMQKDATITWQFSQCFYCCCFNLANQAVKVQISKDCPEDPAFQPASGPIATLNIKKGRDLNGCVVILTESLLFEMAEEYRITSQGRNMALCDRLDSFTSIPKEISQILNEIVTNYAKLHPFGSLNLRGNVYRLISAILFHLVHNYNNQVDPEDETQRMLALDENIREQGFQDIPTIENAASEVHMSTTKFKKIFKKIWGKSYYQYYKDIRLEQAKLLLNEEKLSIKEIASEFGYATSSNFIKAFSRKYQVSPEQLKVSRNKASAQ